MATLTVSQLKDELKRQNVPFEEGKLKKYYLDLHSNLKSSAVDFSDEDEAPAAKPAVPRGRRSLGRVQAPSTPKEVTDVPADDLDDKELRLELTKRGHTPGPITATTRDLYRRMLKDSINAETTGTPKKTPKRTASAAGTPAKTPRQQQKAKPLLLSDDETDNGVSDSDRATDKPSRSNRRSEVEKLQIANPGPRMVQAVEVDGDRPSLRSRRPLDSYDSKPSSAEQSRSITKPAQDGASCTSLLGGSSLRQMTILMFILIAIGIGVTFALRHGVVLP